MAEFVKNAEWHEACNNDYSAFHRFGTYTPMWSRAELSLLYSRNTAMNWDTIQGSWSEFKGKVKESWGKMTDDELDVVAGKRDQLAGLLQKHYGLAKDEADDEIERFSSECQCSDKAAKA